MLKFLKTIWNKIIIFGLIVPIAVAGIITFLVSLLLPLVILGVFAAALLICFAITIATGKKQTLTDAIEKVKVKIHKEK